MLTPDLISTTEFLKNFRPGGPWILTSIAFSKKITTGVFNEENLGDLKDWVVEHNQEENIYFTINSLRRTDLIKASKEDVSSVDWLHVDVDPRPGEALWKEREWALRSLKEPPAGIAPPTGIIFSGGGYQGYWKLKDPIIIDGNKEKADEVALYNKQLEIIFQADHCHNIERIFRLPGTINWPSDKKKARGQRPELAKVELWNNSRVYPIHQFIKAIPIQTQTSGFEPEVEIGGNITRFSNVDELDSFVDESKKLSDRCKTVIVQGNTADHDEKSFPSRSEALFYVCCEMVRSGYDNETIYSVITDPDFGISESVLDKKAGSEKYAKKQIRSAREKAIDPNLQIMNEKFAVIGDIGGKCRVISEIKDPITQRLSTSKQTFEDIRNRYCNHMVEVGIDKNGDPKFQPLGHWWLKHKNRRYYDYIVFAPGKSPDGVYNLWRGFNYEARPGDCSLYLDHLRHNICDSVDENYEYLINWMSRTVQLPHLPAESAVVLRGEMGTGKSFAIQKFGELFGTHFLEVTDPKFLVGSFNAHLEDCVLLFADEAFYAGDVRHEPLLKNLVTSPTLNIEEKGINMRKGKNCLHIMMASNKDWVIPANLRDRRFFVLDVAMKRISDYDYFNDIDNQLEKGGYNALLHYLMTRDISQFNVRKIPKTTGLSRQQLQSLSIEQAWWYSKLQDGVVLQSDDEWNIVVACRLLENDYVSYTKRSGMNRRSTSHQLSHFLRTVMPSGFVERTQDREPIEVVDPDGSHHEIKRPYYYTLDTLEKCREFWNKRFAKLGEWSTKTFEKVPF